MSALSKDDILNADDVKKTEVSVPEWGGHVYVRVMTGTQRDAFEESLVSNKVGDKVSLENMRARMAALTICDEDGALLFSMQDIAALGAKSSTALDRVFEAAKDLNRIGAEEMEELAGNSSGAPS